jgi:hypothetical protein
MTGSDDDREKSRRLDADDQEWSSIGWVLGGQTIRRLGDTMCGLYCAQGIEESGFICLASK